jgi:hypothetical protein
MEMAQPPAFANTYENQTIFLPPMARAMGGTITDTWFRNCVLEGPAVILITGAAEYVGKLKLALPDEKAAKFMREHPEVLFLRQTEEQPWIAGVIALQNCRIEDCTLANIAFAGFESQSKWLFDSVSLGRWAQEMGF